MTSQTKREIPDQLKKILEKDKVVTKAIFDKFDKRFGYNTYKTHMKGLEISCHGIPWLAGCFALLYLGYSQYLWLNMLLLLFIDIIFVSVLKAFTRRRRPQVNQTGEMIMIYGVDKFSFPSGHASRALAVGFFFLWLYPLHVVFSLPILAWSISVAVSRICLGRHHLLDVVGGVALAFVEYLVMKLLWLSPEAAESWGKYLSFSEDPWSSA